MSDPVRPHRRQPTRLPHPWDSPGKNTGVGCHFLLPCMKVKGESEVAQSCPTLSNPMDCSLPGSSVHGILQARVLEWGAIAFSGCSHSHRQDTTFRKFLRQLTFSPFMLQLLTCFNSRFVRITDAFINICKWNHYFIPALGYSFKITSFIEIVNTSHIIKLPCLKYAIKWVLVYI